jgi:hypothetical protein
VLPSHNRVVGQFPSLDALLETLDAGALPAMPHGGYVRVHPMLLCEGGVSDCITARERLGGFGLWLVVTPAAHREGVELRSYTRATCTAV